MRVGFLIAGVIATVLVVAVPREQAVAASPDAAEPLVQEGITLRSQLRDAEALEKFKRAYAIARTPRIEAQIGAAEQALGRWVEAEAHVLEALSAAKDSWIVKNRPTLDVALAAIRAHLGSLEVLGEPEGAEIRIEGEMVGRLPLAKPLRLPAGRTTIEVRAPGHFVATRTVAIEPEKLTRETVVLRVEAAARPISAVDNAVEDRSGDRTRQTPSPNPEPLAESAGNPVSRPSKDDGGSGTSGNGWRRPAEFAAAGLAAAGLAFGIIEHVRWQDKVGSFEAMAGCGADLADRGGTTCGQLFSDGQGARTLTFIGYGAAVAFGATAAVLFLTESGTPGQQIACAPTGGGRALACAWRF